VSLSRQLWLAIIGLTLFAFAGSFLVSILTARSYLEQELYLKNTDNAASLALSLSQLPQKDPVTVELLVSAQFDTGHYQEIELLDPRKKVIVARQYTGTDFGAPDWFVQLIPLRAEPGIAQVQDGWRKLGTLKVVSHSRFAYHELWHGALRQIAWFLAAGLAAGLIGTLLLRLIIRPLNQVVGQAKAISERKFASLAEPSTPELRSVVRAMNDMVARLKQIFSEEAIRLDSLRRRVSHDAVTGLPSRDFFVNLLQETLGREDSPPWGTLLIIRLTDLAELNRHLGHADADQLLKTVASILTSCCAPHSEAIAARLKGADFALLIPNEENAAHLAAAVSDAFHQRLSAHGAKLDNLFHIGAVPYRRGDNSGALLAAADTTLATAEVKGSNTWHATELQDDRLARSEEAWRTLLSDALLGKRLKLALFPVLTSNGKQLHQESAIRLQPEHDDLWLVAGDFMPMAIRHKLTSAIDLEVVQLALNTLQSSAGDIAVNLSAETIADWGFRNSLTLLLQKNAALCSRLWIEVSEYGVFRELEAFHDLARTLKALGCRIGIEHFGHRFNEISHLADLGLDYLKVDSSFIRNIEQHTGNQEFLKGLCKVSHSMGVTVIAEGVQSDAELSALPALGFDAATGPAVSRQNS
jgi:diguanylate cyclase (GGDEF)-like protein